MTKTTMQELFGDADVISSYTCEDAVRDGVLFHPYPKQWPWLLISVNVNAACQPSESDPRTFDQKAVPLLNDVVLALQSPNRETIAQRDGHLTLEHTVAGTVWISPNEMGGATVHQPEER